MKIYSSLVEVLLALPDTITKINPDLIVEYDYSTKSTIPSTVNANITILSDCDTSIPINIKLNFDIKNNTFRATVVSSGVSYYVHSSSQLEFFASELMQCGVIQNNRTESLSITKLTTDEKNCIMICLEELKIDFNKIKVT